jgi:hypothetical protein
MDLVDRIIRAVIGATHLPVTVKTRSGWSDDSRDPVSIARRMQDAGAIFTVRSLALVVQNLLRRAVGVWSPSERTAPERSRVIEVPVLKINDGDIRDGARRTDEFSTNPINELGSLRHATTLQDSQPASVCCERLSQETRTDSFALVIPV